MLWKETISRNFWFPLHMELRKIADQKTSHDLSGIQKKIYIQGARVDPTTTTKGYRLIVRCAESSSISDDHPQNLIPYLKYLSKTVQHGTLQVSFTLKSQNSTLNENGSISVMSLVTERDERERQDSRAKREEDEWIFIVDRPSTYPSLPPDTISGYPKDTNQRGERRGERTPATSEDERSRRWLCPLRDTSPHTKETTNESWWLKMKNVPWTAKMNAEWH